ncbi:hypothetical protein B7P43_G15908 [Cryptotermes secundus]|uniref:ATP-sensitive inward rectifier potassium channel 12 n=2 Tax=Cryptotermes secundus TaxID=105785 RepID=A0A2J7PTN5_9NEOP|nr:hypothetical protein B7P43_G15908 [Cryptotermes secundus]
MVQYTGVSATDEPVPSGVKQQHYRAVLKNGACNLYPNHLFQHTWRFVQDSVTTIVDMQWRYALFLCTFCFFSTWTAFAFLWWFIAYTHGDFEQTHQNSSDWTPCVTELYNFTSCFLFSMENQHTTGFGSRMPTEECPAAIILMCVQGIVGVVLQSILVGLVFLKMVRPKQRTRTLEFSHNAVICRREGKLCFMFRVGDLRRSHIIEAKMRVLFVHTWTTREGEVMSPYRTELKVEDTSDVKSNFFCLLWPETVVHCIDRASPLHELSADDLQDANFEIIVIMEGTIESTDQRVQARTSYLPAEILWGHRFEPVVSYDKSQGRYEVDYSRFHCTQPVETPRSSARDQYGDNREEECYKQRRHVENVT